MRLIKVVGYVALIIFVVSFTLISSSDLSQDLGRHLKMGELALSSFSILSTNYFSYTNSSFPFINHHWLSEVIFYSFSQVLGISSLVILKTFLVLFAIFTAIKASKKFSVSLLVIVVLLSPLLLERPYIRPELFGYVFFAVFLYIIFRYPKTSKLFIAMPFVMIAWVNIHITFVFGVFLLCILLIKMLIAHKQNMSSYIKTKECILICISILSILINPHFISGALYPLFIFGNYGYTIVENQNMFFLQQVTNNVFITYFFLLSPFTFIAVGYLIYKKEYIKVVILSLFFALSIYQIRHLPFFVLSAIPIITYAFSLLEEKFILVAQLKTGIIFFISICIIFVSLFFFDGTLFNALHLNKRSGVMVEETGRQAADFIIQNDLSRNMFNNFDIGGYAIYKLYPKYSVFVDNRPEAYPAVFLKETYIKMQTDEVLRKNVFSKYNIHTVFFAHTDQTPWAESFTKSIYKDTNWKLVYLDSYVMILSDSSSLKDKRNDTVYLNTLIDKEDDYYKLMYLARIFSLSNNQKMFEQAYGKASSIQ